MSQTDDDQARRSAARVSAGIERHFLFFKLGPFVVMPIGASILFVFIAFLLQTWWILWGVAVMLAGLYCFNRAFATRLPRTGAVLDQGDTDDGRGRYWALWGWLLTLVGFAGPFVVGPDFFGLF